MSMLNKIKNKIFHYIDVLYNKYYPPQILFRNHQRKRLKNKNFTLLTGNCIGGYIYHQLGLPFSSPTINLMILNRDFKKFILNLKHYLALTPTPFIDTRFPDVPSALLGDIILHFTHYNSSEEGIEAWEKRKKRIDFDNIYIIISDIDLTQNDIKDLMDVNCKKIVVMTSKNYGYEHCLYLPAFEGRDHVGELLGKTLSGKWVFEKYFDFVGWINSRERLAQRFYIGSK